MQNFEFDYRNTRAFNAAHARSGAPFCCSNGYDVHIYRWVSDGQTCLVGAIEYPDGRKESASWREDGHYESDGFHIFNLVMMPLGLCKDGYVFVGDELTKTDALGTTYFCATPTTRIHKNVRKFTPNVEVPECALDIRKNAAEAVSYMLTVQAEDVIQYLCKAHPGAVADAMKRLYATPETVAVQESVHVA